MTSRITPEKLRVHLFSLLGSEVNKRAVLRDMTGTGWDLKISGCWPKLLFYSLTQRHLFFAELRLACNIRGVTFDPSAHGLYSAENGGARIVLDESEEAKRRREHHRLLRERQRRLERESVIRAIYDGTVERPRHEAGSAKLLPQIAARRVP